MKKKEKRKRTLREIKGANEGKMVFMKKSKRQKSKVKPSPLLLLT